MTTAVISLGNVVATRGVAEWLADGDRSRTDGSFPCLRRHATGDWGEVCKEDKKSNDAAASRDERIISAYTVDERRIWIITEADRSVTTFLFPEEY
jgi:hypothetical protein